MRCIARLLLCLALGLSLAGSLHAQEAPTYVVKAGDTLYSISRRHGMTVAELQALNGLSGTLIKVGQVLQVARPAPSDAVDATPAGEPEEEAAPEEVVEEVREEEAPEPVLPEVMPPGAGGTYVVRPGDTLYRIAARFGTTAYLLYSLNDGPHEPLAPGQVLFLPETTGPGPLHRVQAGETLTGIARAYEVPLPALRSLNGLQGDTLRAGQELYIPRPEGPPEQVPPERLPRLYASGRALVYPETFAGRATASGAPYAPERFTVSHAELPFGTIVLIENPETGRSTFAEVTDRGPLDEAYLMDVSTAVARQLGLTSAEQVLRVRIVE